MGFVFEIRYNSHTVKINAEIIYSSPQIEKIKLTIGTHEMVVESNRPLLKAKHLNKKRILWKVKEGQVNNAYAFGLMLQTMEAYFRQQDKKPYTHPKNF